MLSYLLIEMIFTIAILKLIMGLPGAYGDYIKTYI